MDVPITEEFGEGVHGRLKKWFRRKFSSTNVFRFHGRLFPAANGIAPHGCQGQSGTFVRCIHTGGEHRKPRLPRCVAARSCTISPCLPPLPACRVWWAYRAVLPSARPHCYDRVTPAVLLRSSCLGVRARESESAMRTLPTYGCRPKIPG
jgi:hypothetical protein